MDHLTKIDGVPASNEVVPGMAFFAGTAPPGATCGKCVHRGYYRQSRKGVFNVVSGETEYKSYRVTKCAMFRKMSGGKPGGNIKTSQVGCKYFEAKETK